MTSYDLTAVIPKVTRSNNLKKKHTCTSPIPTCTNTTRPGFLPMVMDCYPHIVHSCNSIIFWYKVLYRSDLFFRDEMVIVDK